MFRNNYTNLFGYISAIIIFFGIMSISTFSQSNDAGNGTVTDNTLNFPLTKINENLYVIYGPFDLPDEKNQGFRNNPVIILTSSGVVVCDPGGSARAGELVIEKVKQLTDKPIVAVFISHIHGDHWLGNEAVKLAFPDAVIYAHPKMKTKFLEGDGDMWLRMVNRLTKNKGKNKQAISPDKTVKNGEIIKIGNTTFKIHHTGIAHTEGDIMVEIVNQNIVFMGDVVRNKFLGIMGDDSSFKGNIAVIDYLINKKFKLYIPGHGKAGDAQMLNAYRSYLSTVYEGVKSKFETGKADYEMKSEIVKNLAAFKHWSGFDIRVGSHISQAYLQVEADAF